MNQIALVTDEKLGEVYIDLDEILTIQKKGRINFKTDQWQFLPDVKDIDKVIQLWINWKCYRDENQKFKG